jgi:hypothetical protein
LNATPVAEENPEPSIVTVVPTAAAAGPKELMEREGEPPAAGPTIARATTVVIAALTVAIPRFVRNISGPPPTDPASPVTLQDSPERSFLSLGSIDRSPRWWPRSDFDRDFSVGNFARSPHK